MERQPRGPQSHQPSLSRILAYSNRPLDLLQGSEHGRVHFPEAALRRPLSAAAPRFKPTASCRNQNRPASCRYMS